MQQQRQGAVTSSLELSALVKGRKAWHQKQFMEKLPELVALEQLLLELDAEARIQVEAVVSHGGLEFPIYSVVMGSHDRSAPCLGLTGGVHGLERVGSQVVIAWMKTLNQLSKWDQGFRDRLKDSRLIFMPIVNPVGIYLTRRANGNGVDLMRNAPLEAEVKPAFMIGGQKISKRLPWYRGETRSVEAMEVESKALCGLIEREVLPSRTAMSVDVHSGFGVVDRLWFPYAKSVRPPPQLIEIAALKNLFDHSYPHHFYRFEPQSLQYTTHGDLWDWLLERKDSMSVGGVYIPWTLELGSWLWVKKNPQQVFSSLGAFNPIVPHRLQRILRRHLTLFDFLHRAVLNPEAWLNLDQNQRDELQLKAMDEWYGKNLCR